MPFYLLFYLNSCPSLLLDLRDSPATELLPISEGKELIPKLVSFCWALLFSSNKLVSFFVYALSAILGLAT